MRTAESLGLRYSELRFRFGTWECRLQIGGIHEMLYFVKAPMLLRSFSFVKLLICSSAHVSVAFTLI